MVSLAFILVFFLQVSLLSLPCCAQTHAFQWTFADSVRDRIPIDLIQHDTHSFVVVTADFLATPRMPDFEAFALE